MWVLHMRPLGGSVPIPQLALLNSGFRHSVNLCRNGGHVYNNWSIPYVAGTMNHSFLKEPFSLSADILQDTAIVWKPLREGVSFRPLFQDPDSGYQVGLIRYEPRASMPLHRHVGDEHIYILSGSQQDERGLYPAGSYIYNPEGSEHSISSQEGCLVLAHWHKPVQFLTE